MRLTQSTFSDSMIRLATVVFPEALPPAKPITNASFPCPSESYHGGRPKEETRYKQVSILAFMNNSE